MPTHRRIRQFNTKQTYPEQKLDNDLSQAVVAGNTVYLRGQVGQDLETRESVGIGDPAAQAEQAMQNIAMLLDEAGAELDDIVKIVIYLTDARYRDAVYPVVGRWLKGVYPVSTGIVVVALARPEWVVEIDATAVIPPNGCRNDLLDCGTLRANRTIWGCRLVLQSGGGGTVRVRACRCRRRVQPEHHRSASG